MSEWISVFETGLPKEAGMFFVSVKEISNGMLWGDPIVQRAYFDSVEHGWYAQRDIGGEEDQLDSFREAVVTHYAPSNMPLPPAPEEQ